MTWLSNSYNLMHGHLPANVLYEHIERVCWEWWYK